MSRHLRVILTGVAFLLAAGSFYVWGKSAHPKKSLTQAPFKLEWVSFGVVPVEGEKQTINLFGPLARYLAGKTGVEIRLKTSKDFNEFHSRLSKGEFGIVLCNPIQYVRAHSSPGYKPLVRRTGKSDLGLLVVKKNGPIKLVADLAGKKAAFAHPAAWASSVLTRQKLKLVHNMDMYRQMKPKFVGTHTAALTELLKGKVDMAGIDRDVLFRLNPSERSRLFIILESHRHISQLVAVHPHLPSTFVTDLKQAFIALKRKKPPGSVILSKLGWKEFKSTKDLDYQITREIMDQYSLPESPYKEEFLWR